MSDFVRTMHAKYTVSIWNIWQTLRCDILPLISTLNGITKDDRDIIIRAEFSFFPVQAVKRARRRRKKEREKNCSPALKPRHNLVELRRLGDGRMEEKTAIYGCGIETVTSIAAGLKMEVVSSRPTVDFLYQSSRVYFGEVRDCDSEEDIRKTQICESVKKYKNFLKHGFG